MTVTAAQVARTGAGQNHVNTYVICWCQSRLPELIQSGKLEQSIKSGAHGDDIEALQAHLIRFGFKLELSKSDKAGEVKDSEDLKNKSYGTYTQRAVRMFALHPRAGESDREDVLTTEGKVVNAAIAAKLQAWCRDGTVSPQDYWAFAQLKIGGDTQQVDAYGQDQGHGAQSAWHHHVLQIQRDLSVIGFGVHEDTLCDLKKKGQPTGRYKHEGKHDKELQDLEHLVTKFQRQAKWLWRMDQEGQHLPDVKEGDATHYAGKVDGIVNAETAAVLRAWVDRKLHMVMNKFELKELHWPPEGSTTIPNEDKKPARLRADAYEAWLAAVKDIYRKGATTGKEYVSSPRRWTGGKPASGQANSPFSFHYTALAVDIDQAPAAGDGTIGGKNDFRFILEEEGEKFRIWCYADPQPEKPKDAADDCKDSYVQYRNRGVVTGSVKPGKAKKKDGTVTGALFHMTSTFKEVAAKEGWYVDMTKIFEEHGMVRIPRHRDWKTNPKAWEWWHYQFVPPDPPGVKEYPLKFGEYLQLYGVHEHKLRAHGWSSHDDIEHTIG